MSAAIDNALGVAGVAAALPGLVQVCRKTHKYFYTLRDCVSIASNCPTNKIAELIARLMSAGSDVAGVLLAPR